MKTINLIFIGDKFYSESGTIMSSIYRLNDNEDSYERFHWGFVNVALRESKNVYIRPATEKEMLIFEKMLEDIKNERKTKRT